MIQKVPILTLAANGMVFGYYELQKKDQTKLQQILNASILTSNTILFGLGLNYK
jgi:hypothetical protein